MGVGAFVSGVFFSMQVENNNNTNNKWLQRLAAAAAAEKDSEGGDDIVSFLNAVGEEEEKGNAAVTAARRTLLGVPPLPPPSLYTSWNREKQGAYQIASVMNGGGWSGGEASRSQLPSRSELYDAIHGDGAYYARFLATVSASSLLSDGGTEGGAIASALGEKGDEIGSGGYGGGEEESAYAAYDRSAHEVDRRFNCM